MNAGTLTVWIMIGIVIFFVILGIIFSSTKKVAPNNPATPFIAEYVPVSIWGGNSKSSDTTRNFCQSYQFEGQMGNVGGNFQGIPAQATLNSDILDSLTPSPPQACYDIDQTVAFQVVHKCITVQVATDGNSIGVDAQGNTGLSFCTTIEGEPASPGQQETYYTQVSTLFDSANQPTGKLACQTTPCTGMLSLLAFNYAPGGTQDIYYSALCMEIDRNNSNFTGKSCDIGNQNQLFRMTRQYPPASTNSTGTIPPTIGGRSGFLTNILDRQTNTCVVPDVDNSGLALSANCGFNWALIPALKGNAPTVSCFQQILYVGDLSPDQIQQFYNVTSPNELFILIQSLSLLSIQLDIDSNLVLLPFVTFPTGSPPPPLASFQYVNYPLFNATLFTTSPTAF